MQGIILIVFELCYCENFPGLKKNISIPNRKEKKMERGLIKSLVFYKIHPNSVGIYLKIICQL